MTDTAAHEEAERRYIAFSDSSESDDPEYFQAQARAFIAGAEWRDAQVAERVHEKRDCWCGHEQQIAIMVTCAVEGCGHKEGWHTRGRSPEDTRCWQCIDSDGLDIDLHEFVSSFQEG